MPIMNGVNATPFPKGIEIGLEVAKARAQMMK